MDTIQKWTLAVSIIGALAWVPHIITLLVKIFQKPILTITPADHCEIGFTELGPIFNIKAALTADHKNILIDSIEFNLKHESGSNYRFKWHEVSEVKGQMIVPGITSQPIVQESEAIAIKILPTDFKDLLFKNRMQEHTQGIKKYDYEFNKERRRLVNNNQYDPEKFYPTKAVQDMQSFMQSQMIWKKGKYNIKLDINNKNNAKTNVPNMNFELSDEDIVLLQVNCDNIFKLQRNKCYVGTSHEDKIQKLEWHFLPKDIIIA